jgi:predicted DNA-binding protein YlxM (UPF0122 family)
VFYFTPAGGVNMSVADIEKNINVSRLFDYYSGLLSDRQREVINLYYNDDLSLGEIADLIGITRQGVHDAIKKSETLLNDYEVKLGFAARFEAVTEAADNLLNALGHSEKELSADITVLSEKLKSVMLYQL